MTSPVAVVSAPARAGSANVFTLQFPFGDEQVLVNIQTTGNSLRRSLFAKVRKYLELAEGDAKDESPEG